MADLRLTFEGGTRTLLGFALAFAAIIAVFVPLNEFTQGISQEVWYLQEVVLFGIIAGVTLVLLHVDGVSLRDIGFSRRFVLPALLAFSAIYVGLNVVGVGIAAVFSLPWGFDFIMGPVPDPFDSLPRPWLLFVLLQVFVGLVEEFALRGYFQNKVIAFVGDGSYPRIAFGILTASVVFGLLHSPSVILSGAGVADVVGVVVARTLTGIFFGTFYELTRNVYFVALLHGFGNTWPLLIDWTGWSEIPLVVFFAAVAFFYVGVTVVYWSWATETSLTPRLRRFDDPSSFFS
jgi:membrane protease YdiL (CAAX protease family)